MPNRELPLEDLAELAADAARKAGKVIEGHELSEDEIISKPGGSRAAEIVTAVDKLAEEAIISTLDESIKQFDFGLLTEEQEDDKSRLEKDFFWCIDPLDGTLYYSEGRPGYCSSIALVRKDGLPVIGVAFDSTRSILVQATHGGGVVANGRPLKVEKPQDAPLLLYTDDSFRAHPSYEEFKHWLTSNSEQGFKEVYDSGGAVFCAMQVLLEGNGLFCKFPKPQTGGGCPWDYAATACIYNEAGAFCSDVDGKALPMNRPESIYFNDLGVAFSDQKDILELVVKFRASS